MAREVHRRDLVTEETGETIQRETKALEDRLEGLIGDAEKRKQRYLPQNNLKCNSDQSFKPGLYLLPFEKICFICTRGP